MINIRPAHSAVRILVTNMAVVAGLVATPSAHSASPEEAGLEIAVEARERGKGFGNFTARQTMVLRNKQGQESRRQLRIKVLEVEGDGDKSMFVFDEPRDVKGTAFLIHLPQGGCGRPVALPARPEAHQLVEPPAPSWEASSPTRT